MSKTKYTLENLIQYCKDNNISLIGQYQSLKRETKIEINCITNGCCNTFKRSFRSIYEGSHLCSECNKISVLMKQKQAKELGYEYEIWVYHPKGNLISIQ